MSRLLPVQVEERGLRSSTVQLEDLGHSKLLKMYEDCSVLARLRHDVIVVAATCVTYFVHVEINSLPRSTAASRDFSTSFSVTKLETCASITSNFCSYVGVNDGLII